VLRAAVFGEPFQSILGQDSRLREQLQRALDAAASSLPVLLLGETGTGKGLVARAIHQASPRCHHPWVHANIGGMVATLVQSELFGHLRGAFSGAAANRRGLFQTAHGGTIFLDEMGEIVLESQVLLLNVVEDGQVRPVGADIPVPVDVRVVAATNRDLLAAVRAGTFRLDLYHRLAAVTITLPPLRQRKDDIPLLAAHFVVRERGPNGPVPEFEPEALHALCTYPWPGNVRELEMVVRRALLFCQGDMIRREHCLLPAAFAEREQATADPIFDKPLQEARDEFTATYLRRLLARFSGDTQRVADHAGVHVTSIRRLMRELHLSRDDQPGAGTAV
jgi:transcriptional regulator with PAS, ATPase and Fis domain